MACDSSYMEPNSLEVELSKVVQLLDELDGKPLSKNYGTGYDSRVYSQNVSKEQADLWVSTLCAKLTKLGKKVKKYSLEMQIWWRDHQIADKARIEEEKRQKADEIFRANALKKLTPAERKRLGLPDLA